MRTFTILTLNNGSHYEDFDNYEDFCKALKRHFTEKETYIYDRLRKFDRSKLTNDGYIKNDYQNMSTLAYPKEDLEESLDKEHDEYLKKMDKKYKTFCKNLELDEKDPDDALSALDELEGQFGDEDGEYQELREFIHNELLESKKITENTEYWEKTIGFNPYDVNYEKNSQALDIIEKFKEAGKLDSLFDYFAAGLVEPFKTEKDYLEYVADTDISDYEIYNGKLEESKNGKYTDEEIRKAIKADIKEHNGLFTDDSKYDVIERLTGIADIDEQPEGLWERVDKIYETEFNK